jgi:hypothetical protein
MIKDLIKKIGCSICSILVVVSIFSMSLSAYTREDLESLWIKVSYNQEPFYNMALQASLAEIYNTDDKIQKAAFSLFEILPDRVLCGDFVLDTAYSGLNDLNQNKIISLKIFAILVQKGLYFFNAFEAAYHYFGNADCNVRQAALHVFLSLINKRQFLNEIFQVSQLCMSDNQYAVRKIVFDIFQALIEKGLYHDQIFYMIENHLLDSDPVEKKAAFDVLNALAMRDKFHHQIFVLAQEELDNNDNGMCYGAREVLAVLATKGYSNKQYDDQWTEAFVFSKKLVTNLRTVNAYSPSIQRAEMGIGHSKAHVKHTTLDFLIGLVRDGKIDSYPEAIKVATLGCKDCYSDIREKSYDLFLALVAKNQAYEEALKAVLQVLNKDPDSISLDALDCSYHAADNEKIIQISMKILINLVMRGKAYDKALLIARQWKHFELLTALVEVGQGYDLAMEVVNQGCGEGIFIKAGVNRLLSMLVYKGLLSKEERDRLIRGKQVLLMPEGAQLSKKSFTF